MEYGYDRLFDEYLCSIILVLDTLNYSKIIDEGFSVEEMVEIYDYFFSAIDSVKDGFQQSEIAQRLPSENRIPIDIILKRFFIINVSCYEGF